MGFRAYFIRGAESVVDAPRDTYALSGEFDYLAEGDVVRVEPARGALRALHRRRAPFNAMLVTERCDNYCVMCSQPPKKADDSWLVDELERAIPLISPEAREICLTGGEPSLLGSRLVDLVRQLAAHLPDTAVHILSNGRGFARTQLARSLAEAAHPDLMVGIPIYADVPEVHDFVVQARGAFSEAVQGIIALKRYGVRVEIRFVIHEETYRGLPAFARFVARNLLFVDHVALMGLEPTGFAKANIEALWVDPVDYDRELRDAATVLDRSGLRVSIYNHQLCVLDPSLHRFARASISDWKSLYLDDCARCVVRDSCGGLFATAATRHSRAIAPIV
ncbi:MAG TPA: His-Xaa-Ser system radical SAM maturase HxsC [Kofleriaceae bacterium]|jgi:His-Xaa-Ser system radical SAM maturase HxsC